MRKLGYMLYHPDAIDIIEQGEYLVSKGCSIVFMDPFNKQKEYPQFEMLLAQTKPNDELVVRDLSYLATSFSDLLNKVDLLIQKSIDLICIDQTISTKQLSRETIYRLMILFAKMYREEVLAKRRETRIKNGKHNNASGRPFGMKVETFIKASEIYALSKEGRLSSKEIMKLKKVKPGTFYRYRKLGNDGKLDPEVLKDINDNLDSDEQKQ